MLPARYDDDDDFDSMYRNKTFLVSGGLPAGGGLAVGHLAVENLAIV